MKTLVMHHFRQYQWTGRCETKLSERARANKGLNKIKCVHAVLDSSEKKKDWDVLKSNWHPVLGRWQRTYNGMFVQTRFIAEDNWFHHTMGNNAPLALAVLIAMGRERGSCHGSNTAKNVCKAKLSKSKPWPQPRKQKEVWTWQLLPFFHDCFKYLCRSYGGYCWGFKPFRKHGTHILYSFPHNSSIKVFHQKAVLEQDTNSSCSPLEPEGRLLTLVLHS